MARPEANPMFPGIPRSEGEASLVVALLVDDPVIVIEGLVDGDEDCELVFLAVCVGVGLELFSFVLA